MLRTSSPATLDTGEYDLAEHAYDILEDSSSLHHALYRVHQFNSSINKDSNSSSRFDAQTPSVQLSNNQDQPMTFHNQTSPNPGQVKNIQGFACDTISSNRYTEKSTLLPNHTHDSNAIEPFPHVSQGYLTLFTPPPASNDSITPRDKSSKYRGVTRTSKCSWGAKYNSKRITNTCKSPEEAAHAYDAYLRAHYPEKLDRYANFCGICGHFVNPLSLPEYSSHCTCKELKYQISSSSISSSIFDSLEEENNELQDGILDSYLAHKTSDTNSIQASNAASSHSTPAKLGNDLLREVKSFESFRKLMRRDASTFSMCKDDSSFQDLLKCENFGSIPLEKSKTLKKQHSLDFENNCFEPSPQPARALSKMHSLDFAVDQEPNDSHEETSSETKATIRIRSEFLPKYWRNDRKNLQCFPYCPEHGNYYRVRLENLTHSGKGVCRAPVYATISIQSSRAQMYTPQNLVLLARCNSSCSRNAAYAFKKRLSRGEMKALQDVSVLGKIERFQKDSEACIRFDVEFYPDVWKFDFELPKKRRNSKLGLDEKNVLEPELQTEFLYYLEIDMFHLAPNLSTYRRLGHVESSAFEMGNTRTLLRQRNRLIEDNQQSKQYLPEDRVLEDIIVPKKKIRMYLGQLARASTVLSDTETETQPSEEITPESCQKNTIPEHDLVRFTTITTCLLFCICVYAAIALFFFFFRV